jgi:hypothetical protein
MIGHVNDMYSYFYMSLEPFVILNKWLLKMCVHFQQRAVLFGCQGDSTLVTLVICHRGQYACTGFLATDVFMSRFWRDVTAESSSLLLCRCTDRQSLWLRF